MGNLVCLFTASTFFQLFGIIPFLVFFLLSRRFDRLLKKKIYQSPFLIAICFFILKIIFTNYFAFLSLNFERNWNGILMGTQLQGITNIFSAISYIFFFIGIIKIKENLRFDNSVFYLTNIIIMFLFSYFYFVTLPLNFLVNFLLSLYPFSTFILCYSFISISFLLKKYNERFWYLSLIGSFILLIDPSLYIYSFVGGIIKGSLRLEVFYFRKTIATLSFLLSCSLVLIPNAIFLKKLIKKVDIIIHTDETAIQKTIKTFLNAYKKLIGGAIFSIFILAVRNHYKKYNVEVGFTPNYELRGISNEEKFKFLDTLIETFSHVTGKICNRILKDISSDPEIREVIEKSKFIASTPDGRELLTELRKLKNKQ